VSNKQRQLPFGDGGEQGDQIGPIFAHRAIVFSGQAFKNNKSSSNSWAIFSRETSCVLVLSKNGLGYT
jgi:hypothetical protein